MHYETAGSSQVSHLLVHRQLENLGTRLWDDKVILITDISCIINSVTSVPIFYMNDSREDSSALCDIFFYCQQTLHNVKCKVHV